MAEELDQSYGAKLIADWLSAIRAGKGISTHTETAYHGDLTEFFAFLQTYEGAELNASMLANLTPRQMRAFLADCQSRQISEASRNRKLSAIKSFLRAFYEQNHIQNDAIFAIRGPKKPARLPRPLSASDAKDAIELTKEIDARPWVQARDEALLTLLYACGLRISEALSLQKQDTPLGAELRIRGKGNKVRIVPVLPAAREAVERYLSLLPFALSPQDAIFRGIRGRALSARQAASLMETLRNLLGLPESATPHAMRHSFASHLLAAGGDIRAIQELLGHSSLSATQIYTKLDKTQLLNVYRDAHPKGKSDK